MLIYNYNQNQVYVSTGVADESPLEPGIYLIPADATSTPVPTYSDGQQAVWNGSSWDIQIVPTPTEEPEYIPTVEELWEDLRTIRDQKLFETDYLALSDTTLTDEMSTYRQTLRDLPANTTDPANPVWPTKPGGAS